jgi:hypothetical protein
VVSAATEVFDGRFAEVYEPLLQVFQVVTGEHIILSDLRSSCHDRTILASSPIVRLL